jgi:pyrroloquinoline quinone biosynthesis protein E
MESYPRKLKEVCLEVIDACPLNCLHCSGNCGPSLGNKLSMDRIKRLLEELSSLGGESLQISGGEPLTYAQLAQVIEYSEGMGLETTLYTSGNILDGHRRIAPLGITLAEKLCQSGLQKIVFNLQGASKETHEAITQVQGSFNNAIKAVRTAKWLGLWVGVHFVPMKPNFREFKRLLQLCCELKVDEIGILRFVPQGRGETNKALLELSKEEFRRFNATLSDLTSGHSENSNIRVGRPIDFRNLFDSSFVKSICDAGISRCTITPSGSVVPCPALKQESRYTAGKLNEASLIDIWNKSIVWREFRHFDLEQIDQPCRGCEYLQLCRGGCSAQRILEYKNLYAAPDPGCFMCFMSMAISSSGIEAQQR